MAIEEAKLPTGKEAENIVSDYKLGFSDPENYVFKSGKGLNREIVVTISEMKNEPGWMTDFRLKSYEQFMKMPMPWWTKDLDTLDINDIHYYVRPTDKSVTDWNDVPDAVKQTFDKLGIPEAERNFLAGVTAQYESEVVYHSMQKELEDLGVIFTDTDTAVREHPELVKKYFGTVIPPSDNKFAALNSAVWSGGSFIWVPKGVKVDIPLQAYFRINTKNAGQFERTLIIGDDDSFVHYVEGCSAPKYTTDALHSAVVEIICNKGSRVRYSTIQNWSPNVYNLVTKRAVAHENAVMEWIDGNIGSKLTMKYPAVILKGEGSRAEVTSIAFAGRDMHQDAGTKVFHLADNTSSTIISKSISKDGGKSTYRGWVKVADNAHNVKVNVKCDALMFGDNSVSDTLPFMEVGNNEVAIEHEATVSKVSEDQLFYLQSRGLSETQATSLIVSGFIEPFSKELPMEYAVELNRLIELEMEGSVG
ncbi:MAG: FeS assembly protein SufB [Bacilli bacterium]|nr:FeS assembly protein SufB [Bacilli bacterium]